MEKSMMQGGFSIHDGVFLCPVTAMAKSFLGARFALEINCLKVMLDAGGKDPLGVDAEGEESIASRLASDLVL